MTYLKHWFLFRFKFSLGFRILAFVFVYNFYCLVRIMDMSLEDKLAALGLDDEATVSPRTGGDRGGNFFTIPSG